ncbi:Uncharacterized protein FKW44_008377 [Caligus rogercresseyi]|uniref:Uncharacterized protein n=1 Tax=Caligus rogercresseyi TaxID=217165 RepID=A0A7T8QU80_CALRO|nr:Uncharacterized protein FKW44_008377 [Caligus rogercresseyi]
MKRLQDSRRHSSPVILPSIVLPPEDEGSEGPESTEEEEDDNPGAVRAATLTLGGATPKDIREIRRSAAECPHVPGSPQAKKAASSHEC